VWSAAGSEAPRGTERETGFADGLLGGDLRLALELVDDVAIARERQAGVVAELAGDVDDAAAFVQEEAREAVAQRVGRGLVDGCCVVRAVEGAAAPGLVGRLAPRGGAVIGEHERVPLRATGRGRAGALSHYDLAITSVYLQGIDNSEIIDTIHARAAPVIPASAGLRL
jgi:CheY-like chemotaxis protein